MKNILQPALFVMSLVAGTLSARASEAVSVQASRDLRVAIFDEAKLSPVRLSLHEAFARSLGEGMGKQCGAPVGVRAIAMDANRAANELGNGVYDVALVISSELPAAFNRTDYAVTRVTSEIGVPVCVFQLVVRKDDPGLKKMVTAAFQEAVNAPGFQSALSRAIAVRVVADSDKSDRSIAANTR
jgi:hypothetical protein